MMKVKADRHVLETRINRVGKGVFQPNIRQLRYNKIADISR
jgi:hypothetical protein